MGTPTPVVDPTTHDQNGDLLLRAIEHTARQEWVASPSGSVWRKRVHRVGPLEAGQVTSVVRYDAGARFPAHDHPDGEEILVLEGIFSDEHGDWPAGTYLLNPEGFRHAPFSRDGCLLFVKLRQFAGRRREHVALDWRRLPARNDETGSIERRTLYQQPGFPDEMTIERWQAGTPEAQVAGGSEIFVLEGALSEGDARYEAGTWLRLPENEPAGFRSEEGALLYVKRGGFGGLWPGATERSA
jgi:anti-sigma factor ChrR (cupin superfamily)